MASIDRYIAAPHLRERHVLEVAASADVVLAQAAAYRTEADVFFRRMIALREAPMRAANALSGRHSKARRPFGIDDFTLLEKSTDEIVYGLAGRFWARDFGLVPIADARAFQAYDIAGSAKLALNFAVRADATGRTTLSTETRILCADRAAWRRFLPYWYLIRPVSGLIRRRILTTIRDASEAA